MSLIWRIIMRETWPTSQFASVQKNRSHLFLSILSQQQTKVVARLLVWGFFPSSSIPSLLSFSLPSFPSPLFPSLPSHNPARGSGERYELHSGVRGGALAANTFWGYFEAMKRFWLQCFRSFSGDKIVVIAVNHAEFVLKN